MRRTLIAVAVVCQASGCGGCGCPEGVERGIDVTYYGWFVDGSTNLYVPGPRPQSFPIADGSPFVGCTELGDIRIFGNASIHEADFPAVVKMGDITGPPDDADAPALLIDGFDELVEMGGIRGKILEVSGFDSVEALTELDGPKVVSGFGALRKVVGNLHVEELAAGLGVEEIGGALRLKFGEGLLELPRLRDVGGDVVIVDTTYEHWSLPALAHIGGSLYVSSNDQLSTWNGFADEVVIDGDVIALGNPAIADEEIEVWLDSGEAEIGGEVCLCWNAGDQTNCDCLDD